jgi:hypothetical protein
MGQPGTDAHPHPHGSLENVEVAHEHSDINIRGIVWFLALLVVVAIVTHVAMWGLFVALDKYEASNDPYVTPLAAPAGQLPPEPRLQTTPWQDLHQFRVDEEKRIHSYGWIDQRGGIGHVPIERAKELLLQRGLPARPGGDADPTEGTRRAASGESTGGRNIRSAAAPKQ